MATKLYRSVKNAKLLLSLIVLLISFDSVADIKLPPMPGPENDRTLLGVDTNRNQVRDDVEIFIYNKLTKKPKIYKAYLNMAQSHYFRYKHINDIKELNKFDIQFQRDGLCIDGLEKLPLQKSLEHSRILINALVNTDLRTKAENEIGSKVTPHSMSVPDDKAKLCR